MKKLVLMIMLFLGAQCDAHPWDGSLTSPRIWENPNEEVGEFIQKEDNEFNEFGWVYYFIRFIDLENILFQASGEPLLPLGDDDLI